MDNGLPLIPDKRYFAIGEVSELCGVKSYILRYWEQEFPQLKPNKRRGNRRYYQYKDVLVIRQIRKLLYQDGFTIDGARSQLSGQYSVKNLVEINSIVAQVVSDLESVLHALKN
ncbi:MerR family transcriptional regulator [Gammaproteobacteria bacterium]|nr:MerR family transcriptional regulator [Gammaproteobacteria bacterium]